MRSTGKAESTAREGPVHGVGVPGGVSGRRSLLDREIVAHAILDVLRKFNLLLRSAGSAP